MSPESLKPHRDEAMTEEIRRKAERKLRAQRNGKPSVWFGFGLFGLIGWSIAIPTIAGVALGVWVDKTWPGQISWTLTLMFCGLCIGCVNAWRWVQKESRKH